MSSPIEDVQRAVALALTPLRPARVGIACSGGADSLVLADAAVEVAGAASIVLLHVDHGLSDDSGHVAGQVVIWAGRRGVAVEVRRVHVQARASLEMAARLARYEALDAMADDLALIAVATAHTARDRAETVLMRVLRGTGVAGLVGIARQRERYLRPLLALPRTVIDAYVLARALPVWEDPMNADPRFFRVRVRRHLMPLLRQENPQIEAALLRLGDHATEWMEAIDALAEPLSHRLSASELARFPAAVRKRAFALALTRRRIGFDAEHLDSIDRAMSGPARGSVAVDLPGATVVREYDLLLWPQDSLSASVIPPNLRDPSRYLLRTRRPGDRMRLARLRGRTRKVSDLFIDAKVPRRLRLTATVVCRVSDDVIVWVEHLGWADDRSS